MAHSLSSSHFLAIATSEHYQAVVVHLSLFRTFYTSGDTPSCKTWQFPQQRYTGVSWIFFCYTLDTFEKTFGGIRLTERVTFSLILMSFVHLPFLFSPTLWTKTQDTLKPSIHQARARISELVVVSSLFSLPWDLKSFETPLAWVPPWYPSSQRADNWQNQRFMDLVHAYKPKSTAIFVNYDVTYYGLVEKPRTGAFRNRYLGLASLAQSPYQFCCLALLERNKEIKYKCTTFSSDHMNIIIAWATNLPFACSLAPLLK